MMEGRRSRPCKVGVGPGWLVIGSSTVQLSGAFRAVTIQVKLWAAKYPSWESL